MAMDSPEYKTLSECYSDLVTCIQQSPNDIADQKEVFKVLAPEDLQFVRNSVHQSSERARRILDIVLNQVKIDPQVYHSFISALNNAGAWTKTAVDKLNSFYSNLTKSCPEATGSVDKTDSLHTQEGMLKYC